MNREEGFKAIARLQEAGMFNKPEGGSALNRKQGAKLRARQKDYDLMVSKPKIGDGHRDANGYTKPGSNKK